MFFGALPRSFVNWSSALHVLAAAVVVLEKHEKKADDVRAVEAMSFVTQKDHEIRSARFPVLRGDVRGPSFWTEFNVWLSVAAENLAAGNEPVGDRLRVIIDGELQPGWKMSGPVYEPLSEDLFRRPGQ